jgi:hypothetical protein
MIFFTSMQLHFKMKEPQRTRSLEAAPSYSYPHDATLAPSDMENDSFCHPMPYNLLTTTPWVLWLLLNVQYIEFPALYAAQDLGG